MPKSFDDLTKVLEKLKLGNIKDCHVVEDKDGEYSYAIVHFKKAKLEA